MTGRALILAAVAVAAAGCSSSLDRSKFEATHKAALAIQQWIEQTGGAGPEAEPLQRALDVELAALTTAIGNDRERELASAFTAVAEAYRDFFLFRQLDLGSTDGRLMLAGRNIEVAKRYTLTVDEGWVDSRAALKYSHAAAERAMGDVDRLLRAE